MGALMAGCALESFFVQHEQLGEWSQVVVQKVERMALINSEQLWILVNEIIRDANQVNVLQ